MIKDYSRGKAAPTQLIIQALSAAEASIGLAKQLLSAQSGFPLANTPRDEGRRRFNQPSSRDLPGIIGTFDGENMVVADGKNFPVPTNYAGKSKLVYGDTLKRIENADGTHLFKQIEKVERVKVDGKLSKKGDQWVAETKDAVYKVLNSNVSFLGGQIGDETVVLVPAKDQKAPWAAIDAIPVRDAERYARRIGEAAAAAPKVERPTEEKTEVGLVGRLLGKVTAKAEKKEKGEVKVTAEKVERKPRKSAAKTEKEDKEKEKAKGEDNVPPPPAAEDEGELR